MSVLWKERSELGKGRSHFGRFVGDGSKRTNLWGFWAGDRGRFDGICAAPAGRSSIARAPAAKTEREHNAQHAQHARLLGASKHRSSSWRGTIPRKRTSAVLDSRLIRAAGGEEKTNCGAHSGDSEKEGRRSIKFDTRRTKRMIQRTAATVTTGKERQARGRFLLANDFSVGV